MDVDVKNPLRWWPAHKATFPHLAQLAQQYLSAPGGSGNVERLFSQVGLVNTPLRRNMASTSIRDALFVARNTGPDWDGSEPGIASVFEGLGPIGTEDHEPSEAESVDDSGSGD